MEKKFPDGFWFNKPQATAPDYVIGGIKVDIDLFTKYMKENRDGDYMRFNVKKSKTGNIYIEVDTWKPSDSRPASVEKGETKSALDPALKQPEEINPNDIPF